jgi:uncharacterized protein (TIGR03083 family)
LTHDRDLQGLDPYDVFDQEADRLDRFFTSIDGDDWSRPTRCPGWSVRDVLGHLRAGEVYFQACLDGTVDELLARFGERGVTDLHGANALGIADFADVPTDRLFEQWRVVNADTRARFRDRDGGEVDSMVGAYPARWQTFHVASELATHADDVGVPATAQEEPARTRWRAAISRFALKEFRQNVEAEPVGDSTRYRVGDVEGTVSERDFVALVAGRPPDDPSIPERVREALSTMP